jgi:hypothetical protein
VEEGAGVRDVVLSRETGKPAAAGRKRVRRGSQAAAEEEEREGSCPRRLGF